MNGADPMEDRMRNLIHTVWFRHLMEDLRWRLKHTRMVKDMLIFG
jgi:hypothetical protein